MFACEGWEWARMFAQVVRFAREMFAWKVALF
jgi:hypothetical protein